MTLIDMSFSGMDALILSMGAIIAGIYFLAKGGAWTIDGAVSLANRAKISPLLIGFTIIAFGTSLPELIVSVNANIKGFAGLSIGNVIGSNIANILLVIGATAMITPLVVTFDRAMKRDLCLLGASTLALVYMIKETMITQGQGAAMLGILIIYVVYQFIQSRKADEICDDLLEETKNVYEHAGQAALFLLLGLVGIALGAEILVRGAVVGATVLGVPESVIGVTLVAFGTSLPELVTCVIAARQNQTGLVLGNIIGSCVFNILSIIGITALISGMDITNIADALREFDSYVMMIVTLFFMAQIMVFKKFGKTLGMAMLIVYCGFTIYKFI